MASSIRQYCKNPVGKFCYVFRRFILKSQVRPLSEEIKKAYFYILSGKLGTKITVEPLMIAV